MQPFENLTMGEIQTKLRLRGCIDVDMPKAQLIAKLKNILEGCKVFLPFYLAVQLVSNIITSCIRWK